MLPCWKIENIKRRVNRARNFPHNTDPCSRHVQMIADALLSKRREDPIEELWDAEYMASSLLVTVENLWKCRTELQKLKSKQEGL